MRIRFINQIFIFSLYIFICSFPKAYANVNDDELFYIGTVTAYAGMCLNEMNIKDDANSEAVGRKIAEMFVNKYDAPGISIFQNLAIMGIQSYESDKGARCPQMLEAAKNISSSLGLQCTICEKAITYLQQKNKKSASPSREDSNIKQQIGNTKLTDNLHNKFLLEDNDYALADIMLNATWKMVKKNLDKGAFASVLKDQREWASQKRDRMAASYASSMPLSQAYAKVMQKRITELSSLVAREPHLGDYDNDNSLFNIYKDNDGYHIDGSADSPSGNTCLFEGKISNTGGWYKVHEGGLPPYYILFTDKGAIIEYLGDGSDHGCGSGVHFKGEYTHISR